VTREKVKVDRVACPWLIRKFVDPQAEFLFVPADQIMDVANREGATPYDVEGVELSHDGPRCSFDAFLGKYSLSDPILQELAVIVRGADTARLDCHDTAEDTIAKLAQPCSGNACSCCGRKVAESKVDDAVRSVTEADDKLAEILVEREQDALLASCPRQHVGIGRARSCSPHPGDVVASRLQHADGGAGKILVGKEPHVRRRSGKLFPSLERRGHRPGRR